MARLSWPVWLVKPRYKRVFCTLQIHEDEDTGQGGALDSPRIACCVIGLATRTVNGAGSVVLLGLRTHRENYVARAGKGGGERKEGREKRKERKKREGSCATVEVFRSRRLTVL